MTQQVDDTELSPATRALLRRVSIRSRFSAETDCLGGFRSHGRGASLQFRELREYEPHDDIRHIDWRATARVGRPLVKTYDEERSLNVVLVVDCSSSMRGAGVFSHRSRVIDFTRIIEQLAINSRDRLGLLTFDSVPGEFLPPRIVAKRSRLGLSRSRIVSTLARRFTGNDRSVTSDLEAALNHLRGRLSRRSIVFIVSDFHAPLSSEVVRRIASRHDLVGVLLQHPLPDAGLIRLGSGEGGVRSMVIDSSEPRVRRSYETLLHDHEGRVRELLGREGGGVITVREDVVSPVIRFLDSRARRVVGFVARASHEQ